MIYDASHSLRVKEMVVSGVVGGIVGTVFGIATSKNAVMWYTIAGVAAGVTGFFSADLAAEKQWILQDSDDAALVKRRGNIAGLMVANSGR